MSIDTLDRRPLRRWRSTSLALLLATLLTAVAAWLLLPPAHGAATVLISAALSADGEGDSFPLGVPARTISLPDDWAESRPGSYGPAWYRVAFFVTEPRGRSGRDLLAVYIARACTNLEVFANGQLVHSGGRMVGNVTYNCNQPQLVSLPATMVRDGVNTLDIKLVGVPASHVASRQRAGGLSAIEIGRYQELAPHHEWQTALQVGLPQGLSATMLLMGGFMFLMGWVNRSESHLAYFGALSAGWAVVEARLWWRELPFSGEVIEFLLASTMPFIALAAVQFLLRYSGRRERWISAALAAQCALMPVSLAIGGAANLNVLARFWYTLLALQVLAASATYLRTQWQVQRRSFWLMAGLLGIVTMAVLVEFVGLRAALPPGVAVAAQTVSPLILILVGLRLVQQHGLALKKSESDRLTLEARIAQATAEIENNFKQLAQLRVEQVTERERKRIAADLHDDLGAKLLTIVHTSESERISTLAREALEEMRLSVRGLTGRPVVLDDAIADWRAEIVSRLGQAGIESEWSIPLVELPQTLSARAYVQTTRIIRESVSNVIKHSGATRCTVTCAVVDGDFQFVIQDNGKGIPLELDGRLDRGHGMAGMKARAKQLQGQCLVESGPGYGTVIRLTIPLDRAIEPA